MSKAQGGMLRLADFRRGREVAIFFDEKAYKAHMGESIAVALMCAGLRDLRQHGCNGGRGYYCGMGVCWECAVYVSGKGNVRACAEPVQEAMHVYSLGRMQACRGENGK